MKKLLLSALMLAFAGTAVAAEQAFVLVPYGPGPVKYVEPCNPDQPTPANGLCGDGRECPVGYEAITKYCFGGGLHKCGIACQPDGTYRGH